MEITKIILGILIITYIVTTIGITLYWLFNEWYDLGHKAYHSDGIIGFVMCSIYTFIFVAVVVAPVEIIAVFWKFLLECKNIIKAILTQFNWRLAHIKSEIKTTSKKEI